MTLPTLVSVDSLFAAAGANAQAAAIALAKRLREYPDTSIDHSTIKDLEQTGDQITSDIVHVLLENAEQKPEPQAFYKLAGAIDDVVDHIEHVSDLLDLYKVEVAMQQALDQGAVLVRAATLLRSALETLDDPLQTRQLLKDLKQAEDEGDQLERQAIASLFEDEGISPRVIIQWKDIFDGLEAAIDACEHAGMFIGNLMFRTR